VTRGRAAGLALGQFALHALLLAGALGALPDGARLAVAFVALVLLPGHGWLEAIGTRPPGGAALASGWALGLGIAWLGALVLATRALHVPFTALASAAAVLSLLPWWLVLRRRPAAVPVGTPPAGLRGVALAAVLVAAAIAALHCARLGTPITYYTDSPDHIGTIRRMLTGGDAFPTDAFFRDAGPMGADPRKALWHPIVALLCRLAHVDPWPAWRWLPALLAPLFVLNAAVFGWLLGGGLPAAVAAWALLLTYGGSLSSGFLREAGLSTKVADQLALATAAAVVFDLEARSARSRGAAIGLALGAVAAHVFAALQFATVFGALGLGLLIRDRGAGPALRRLVATTAWLGAACLPWLLWRAHGAYAPNNVIHTYPQGLLWMSPRTYAVNPGCYWEWLGFGTFLFPLCWWAWAKDAARPAVLYLLMSSLAVFSLTLVPPFPMLLHPRLGYLLMRFVWMLPLSAALAYAVSALVARFATGTTAGRLAAAGGFVVLAALLRHPLADAAQLLRHPSGMAEHDRVADIARWREPLAWMDAHLPQGSVVLSDPATSYAIPMATRHWVATLLDQHSSPNDSLALTRILEARDALDPGSGWTRTREIVLRRGITAIALNDRFAEVPRLDYWSPGHEWFAAARARLDACPSAFRRVYDTGDFVVYGIDRAVLDTLRGEGRPRPGVTSPAAPETGAVAVGRAGLPSLAGFHLSRRDVLAGDTLTAVCVWSAPGRLPAGSYLVAIRFDRALPADFHAPAWLAKPVRKWYEAAHRERYRFRADHLPAGGAYGLDLWRVGERITDAATVEVPRDAAPGDYQVQVRVLVQPHYPNYRLADFFFDRDYYSGRAVDTLRVGAPGASR
jgi:hypothetical protein